MEGPIEASDPKPFQMAKSVFQSCMNKERIELNGFTPVKSVLKKMGGWPLLEGASWDQDSFKWYEMVYKFRDMGYSVDYMVDFSVTTDLKNSSYRILDLDQPGLGMSREYLMKGPEDPDVQVYPRKAEQSFYNFSLKSLYQKEQFQKDISGDQEHE